MSPTKSGLVEPYLFARRLQARTMKSQDFLWEVFKNTGQQDPDIHNETKNVKFIGPDNQECVLELFSRVSLEI